MREGGKGGNQEERETRKNARRGKGSEGVREGEKREMVEKTRKRQIRTDGHKKSHRSYRVTAAAKVGGPSSREAV